MTDLVLSDRDLRQISKRRRRERSLRADERGDAIDRLGV
jgi:hypothetical protein